MPSLSAILIKKVLAVVTPRLKQKNIATTRKTQNQLGRIASWLAGRRVAATPQQLEHCSAALIRVKANADQRQILFYLHGGAYTAGGLNYAQGMGRRLASKLHLDVFCLAYRLAPENPFPAALDDALARYQQLLQMGYAPEEITLIGESAGGGLLYALSLLLRQKGMAQPKAIIALSPWVDLLMRGASYQQNQSRDPSLNEQKLHEDAAMYAAGHLEDPLVSPLYGQLSGTPRSLIICGGDELLLDDAKLLANKLSQDGCEAELLIGEYMWHAYVLYPTAESAKAIARIAAFLGIEPRQALTGQATP